MSSKAKQKHTPEELLKIQVAALAREFADWEYINKNGCNDPFWPDGSNMNLVHNHICHHKSEIEIICTENNLELPEIYYKETPPEVDQDYMAIGFLEGPSRRPNREEREDKDVPKQTYYTKCGREFQKNSTATVTGYDIDINDPECADCPFEVEVTEGWPPVHKKWECRAGSQPPNHTTEWTGSLENKNTISIHSLDNQLMEEIKEFCEEHPDLGASYNADHMADCRRTMAISCSSNKKGMAAKRELIEKFFPEATAVPDQRFEKDICGDCSHLIDDGSCVSGYGRCNYKNRRMAKDHEACVAFEQALFDVQKCRVCGCTEDNACEGGCCWVEDDLCSKCADAIAEDEEQIYIYRGLV